MMQINQNSNQGLDINQLAMMQQYNGTNKEQSTVDKLFQQQPDEIQSKQQYNMANQSKKIQKKQKIIEREQNSNDNDTELEEQHNKIRHLVKNINHGLDEYAPSKSHVTEDDDTYEDTEKLYEKKHITQSQQIMESNDMLNMAKEVVLLVLIYIILSQNFVRQTIGAYICYINPKEDGSVSIIGYLIYGLLLAVTFVFFKKNLLK